jgi:hypothetical protein
MATVAREAPPRSSIDEKTAIVMAAHVDDSDAVPAFERLPDEIIEQYAVPLCRRRLYPMPPALPSCILTIGL